MLKSAFMLGAGLGLVGGMFLVKLCPKAEKMVSDITSKAENSMGNNCSNSCECGSDCGSDCNCGCQDDKQQQQ